MASLGVQGSGGETKGMVHLVRQSMNKGCEGGPWGMKANKEQVTTAAATATKDSVDVKRGWGPKLGSGSRWRRCGLEIGVVFMEQGAEHERTALRYVPTHSGAPSGPRDQWKCRTGGGLATRKQKVKIQPD